MKRFAHLFEALDRAASADAKVAAIRTYLASAPADAAAGAVSLLTGRTPKRVVTAAVVREWAAAAAGVDPWLMDECHAVVGDAAETAALVLDAVSRPPAAIDRVAAPAGSPALRTIIEEWLPAVRERGPVEQRALVTSWWMRLDRDERLVLNKLLTGTFRARVSAELVERAVSDADSAVTGRSVRRTVHPANSSSAPHTVLAVLLYAHPDRTRGGALTEYTLALWDDGDLVPVAKLPSGLSDDENLELDRWIRRHTRERFGPVRHVEPELVLELVFDGVEPSARHRSGLALTSPRIVRWVREREAAAADALDRLRSLLQSADGPPLGVI